MGDVDEQRLSKMVKKVEKLIERKIRSLVLSSDEYIEYKKQLQSSQAIWLWGEA